MQVFLENWIGYGAVNENYFLWKWTCAGEFLLRPIQGKFFLHALKKLTGKLSFALIIFLLAISLYSLNQKTSNYSNLKGICGAKYLFLGTKTDRPEWLSQSGPRGGLFKYIENLWIIRQFWDRNGKFQIDIKEFIGSLYSFFLSFICAWSSPQFRPNRPPHYSTDNIHRKPMDCLTGVVKRIPFHTFWVCLENDTDGFPRRASSPQMLGNVTSGCLGCPSLR